MLAAEQKVDFIVSLAGMVVSGAETLLAQNRIALAEAGIDASTINTYCRALEDAFNAVAVGSGIPDIEDYDLTVALKQNYLAVLNQIQMPYMRHFIALDIRPLLGKITCPVLALNGNKDIQVEYESNLSALRSGLPANDGNCIEIVDGVNHLFQHCKTGAVTEYREIEETISPAVLETIIQWIL